MCIINIKSDKKKNIYIARWFKLLKAGDMILKLRFLYVNVSGFNLLAMIGLIVKYVRNSHGSRTRQFLAQCANVLIKASILIILAEAVCSKNDFSLELRLETLDGFEIYSEFF